MRPFLALVLAAALAACANPAPSEGAQGASQGAASAPGPALTSEASALPTVTMYASPMCGCCKVWAAHLESEGFPVATEFVSDLRVVKANYGIPDSLASCHTAVVDGYVIEGHVPARDVKRLLAERPEAAGLSVPGMPIGSPGMEVEGQAAEAYNVFLVGGGETSVFARH